MSGRDIIVIGASAGGVEALTRVVRGLPSGLPASLFVVCHAPAEGRGMLPEILSRSGPLLAAHPTDGDPFYPGHIYVAPRDYHMALDPEGRIRLGRGPRENHHRPAIDPLFRSAARHFGPRVIGVILTGALYDGTAGLMAVRSAGGLGVVQDPADAQVSSMPRNASQLAGVDHVVPLEGVAPLLVRLVHQPPSARRGGDAMDPIERMPELVKRDFERQANDDRRGEVSVFTCPECGGPLWQVDDSGTLRFRCHVGHAYHAQVLLSEQADALETALWTAVRTFKEQAVLATQLANREQAAGNGAAAQRFWEKAEQSARFGELVHQLLVDGAPAGLRRDEPVAGGTG